jgi:hypothetical protein
VRKWRSWWTELEEATVSEISIHATPPTITSFSPVLAGGIVSGRRRPRKLDALLQSVEKVSWLNLALNGD